MGISSVKYVCNKCGEEHCPRYSLVFNILIQCRSCENYFMSMSWIKIQ